MDSIPARERVSPFATLLTPALILFLAGGAGAVVAALYYSQPLLGILGPDIGTSARAVGLMPTLTQVSYLLGIFYLAPLGDRLDGRRIVLPNAMLFTGMFIGMAVGSALGALLFAQWGWIAVTALSALAATAALTLRCWPQAKPGGLAS